MLPMLRSLRRFDGSTPNREARHRGGGTRRRLTCVAVCALMVLGSAAEGKAAPGDFNKLAPANGATNRLTTPTFSWEASAGAVSYEVCGSLTAVCPSPSAWESVGNLTSAPWPGAPLDYDTTYYWQVRAVAADGSKTGANGGTWWHFTTRVQAPGAFGKTSPPSGAADQATSLTVTWGTSARATSYEYLLRHHERRSLRRRVDGRRIEHERLPVGPEPHHDVLLARARRERGRDHLRRQQYVVELHDANRAARGVQQDLAVERGDGAGGGPGAVVGSERAGRELSVLLRHHQRQLLFRELGEHRNRNRRRPARAELRHDVLLAGAGDEHRRHHGRQQRHLVELPDAGGGASRVRQDEPGQRGPVDGNELRADVGGQRPRRELRILLRHDQRRRLRQLVDERGIGHERLPVGAELQHDLLLAGAGGERGRHDGRQQRRVVERHHAGRAAGRVQQDLTRQRRGAFDPEHPAHLGPERRSHDVPGTASTRRTPTTVRGSGSRRWVEQPPPT